ncbi:hypothetical protein ABTM67_20250, partial [Acinetobacter baumannii]
GILGTGAENDLKRGKASVDERIKVLLTPAGIKDLLEKAERIEASDRYKRQAHVAGFFAVVSGQNAEPATVLRKRFVEPEFG